jgi:hypothetical protein
MGTSAEGEDASILTVKQERIGIRVRTRIAIRGSENEQNCRPCSGVINGDRHNTNSRLQLTMDRRSSAGKPSRSAITMSGVSSVQAVSLAASIVSGDVDAAVCRARTCTSTAGIDANARSSAILG